MQGATRPRWIWHEKRRRPATTKRRLLRHRQQEAREPTRRRRRLPGLWLGLDRAAAAATVRWVANEVRGRCVARGYSDSASVYLNKQRTARLQDLGTNTSQCIDVSLERAEQIR